MAKRNGEEGPWITKGDESPRRKNHDLYRVPKTGVKGVIITSAGYSGRLMHYWAGRSMPHIEPWCPACDDGNSSRPVFWVSCWGPTTNKHVIFEVTAYGRESLDEYIKAHSTLRGAEIRAERKGGKMNGKQILQLSPTKFPTNAIPKEFDFRAELEHMWASSNIQRRARPENEA